VFAGMLAVTVAGLVFTPVFYVLLQRRSARSAQPDTTGAVRAGTL
jgi:gold/copper resistance efflux pump